MSDESRRSFLQWLALAPAAAAAGCQRDRGSRRTNAERGGDSSGSGTSCEPTGSDARGPFYAEGAPKRTNLAPDDEPGTPIVVSGTVYGPDCETPLSRAVLDIWHANRDGEYYDGEQNYRLRGQILTDDDGTYEFESIRPGNYPMGDEMRPAHIHYTVAAPDHEPLTTQMYFAGDPHLAPNDPCGSCNSDDSTQIVEVAEDSRDGSKLLRASFDIVLTRA